MTIYLWGYAFTTLLHPFLFQTFSTLIHLAVGLSITQRETNYCSVGSTGC
jgi:hypothetical protein